MFLVQGSARVHASYPTHCNPHAWLVLRQPHETNYKSGKAVAAKKHLKFKVMSLPRYSPDLNPLDFLLIWENIETRMLKEGPKSGRETVEQYKARLRQTAMKTSRVLIKKAILNMNVRIKAVYKAKGGHIDMD
jgi:hypothetical protein